MHKAVTSLTTGLEEAVWNWIGDEPAVTFSY